MAKLDALLKKKKAVMAQRMVEWKASPDVDMVQTMRASCRIDEESGTRLVRMGEENWQIISDSGPAIGGTGQGPGAVELLCGSLASCLVHMYFINAALMDIPLDDLCVEVTAKVDYKAVSGLESGELPPLDHVVYTVHIESPSSTEDIQRLHEATNKTCTVKNSLLLPVQVERVEAH